MSTDLGSTESMSTDYGQCSSTALEQYAQRRTFTQRLIEQRERNKFESELSAYEQRRAFTERLMQQRAQLSDADRKQFDEQVERYVRLHEVTLRIQDEHDLRDALAFAEDLAMQERKRVFTRRLVEARTQGAVDTPTSGATDSPKQSK